MTIARVFTVAAGCVVLGAAAASCSGSFGSGSGMPNTLASPSFGGPSTAPTPAAASSVILTYGENTSFQTLPEVGGYGGSIAFPKAPEPTLAPAAKGKTPSKDASPAPSPTAVAVAIGVTFSIVKPQDGPDLNFVSGKGKRKKSREQPARALAYITLLPTHDATLESYPRFALDIPREVASQYRDGEFGLALWNSGEKDAKYRLAVAELDTVSTPPPRAAASVNANASAKPGASGVPSALPSGTLLTTPKPGVSAAPGVSPVPGASGSPGAATPVPSAAPTLPPQRIVFAATATPLKLMANRPAIFALYALPHPASSGAPKASVVPAATGTTSPQPSASSAASAFASAMPAAPGKTP